MYSDQRSLGLLSEAECRIGELKRKMVIVLIY